MQQARHPRPHLSTLPEELLGLVYGALEAAQDRRAFRSSAAFLRHAGPVSEQVRGLTVDLRCLLPRRCRPSTMTTPLSLRVALGLTRLEVHADVLLPPRALTGGLRALLFSSASPLCLPNLRQMVILSFEQRPSDDSSDDGNEQPCAKRPPPRVSAEELRAVGRLLRRAAPNLAELGVDVRLNLTRHFYDGLLLLRGGDLPQHDEEDAKRRTLSPPPPPSLETLCIPAGDSFPIAAPWSWPALRVLDLRKGLRNGHGAGLSEVLRACPNLSRLYLNTLVPGIDWTRRQRDRSSSLAWPSSSSLVSLSIDRLYSPDPQAVYDLCNCVLSNPRLEEIFVDDFFINDLRILEAMHLVAASMREVASSSRGAGAKETASAHPRLTVATVVCDGAFVPDTTFYTGVGEVTEQDMEVVTSSAAATSVHCIDADLVARLDMFDEFVAPLVDLGLHYMRVTASGARLLRAGLGRRMRPTTTADSSPPPLRRVSMLDCEVEREAVDALLMLRPCAGTGAGVVVPVPPPRELVLGFDTFFSSSSSSGKERETRRGTIAPYYDCDVHVVCCCRPSSSSSPCCCRHHPDSVVPPPCPSSFSYGRLDASTRVHALRLDEPPVEGLPQADGQFLAS